MIIDLLQKQEGKTFEFKENTKSLQKIVETVIAFANTAGGTVIIGVEDKTKEIIGLENILLDEERLANSIAASVEPLLIPTFQMHTFDGKDVLLVSVSHTFGPFYLKSKGLQEGTFIRLGSTNRPADKNIIREIEQLKQQKHFDELPNFECPRDRIDFDLAKKLFKQVGKDFNEQKAKALKLLVAYQTDLLPSNAAVLLFGQNHQEFLPDAIIRCARFFGTTKVEIIDQLEIEEPIAIAIDSILKFIRRNTRMAAQIKEIRRKNIPEYPIVAVREAIINALLHADYSIRGSSITIGIFDDRIEITNPGPLPFGLDLESALAGYSQLRNKIIGHVFKELHLIEQWGSGLGRMIEEYQEIGVEIPKFEERGYFFRATLYPIPLKKPKRKIEKSEKILE